MSEPIRDKEIDLSNIRDEDLVQISLMVPSGLHSTIVATASGMGMDPSTWVAQELSATVQEPKHAQVSKPTSLPYSTTNNMVQFNFRISEELDESVAKLATDQEMTYSEFVVGIMGKTVEADSED